MNDIHIPGYEILKQLGIGGMARVYKARQLSLEREVAIKVLRADLGDDVESFKRRFFNEGRILASITHPNIVAVYDLGEAGDALYIAMELVPGDTLEEMVRRDGVTLEQAIGICRKIAGALDRAHAKGVIHRDIKPSNILMEDLDTPKLVDFGIARGRQADVGMTQEGVMLGTPLYMSPEQVQGVAIDERTDIYALGVTLYWLLAGRHPFEGDAALGIALKHLHDPIPELPEAVAGLQAIVERAMAKDPADRFQSAREFADALDAVELDGPPLHLGVPTADPAGPTLGRTQPAYPTLEVPRRGASPATKRGGWLSAILGWFGKSDDGGEAGTTGRASAQAPAAPDPQAQTHPQMPSVSGSEKGATPAPTPAPWQESTGAATILSPITPPAEPESPPTLPGELAPPSGDDTQFLVPGEAGTEQGLVVSLAVTSSPDPSFVGTRVQCQSFPFRIGRGGEADLKIERDSAISRNHAEIFKIGSGYYLKDTSANGIVVNGQLGKDQSVPLPFNSSIQLSDSTTLTFQPHLELLPDLTGQRIGDRFDVEKALHHSIKASTYRCRDLDMPRTVVVKLFSPHLMSLEQFRDEFERQARLTMKFTSPHIVKVLEFKEFPIPQIAAGKPVSYVCTEYMEGGSLARRMDDEDFPEAEQALNWVVVLARALDHAHRRGVVHGDLKPSCIVFDADGAPYVTDFAMAVTEGEGKDSARTGTPAFWAPEQWDRQAATERTDQYSLAVLAYFMLSGARPFEGQSQPRIRERNFRRGPEPVHEVAERRRGLALNSNLSQVLARGMSVDPEARYESVTAFATALSQAAHTAEQRRSTPRVFISYRRKANAGWANLFDYNLRNQFGFEVFIDARAVDGSPQIPTRVRNEIDRCDVFVCLLHPETLESDWVRAEIKLAHEARKPMVPVFSEHFQPGAYKEAAAEIQALLDHEAVILLDQKNVYLDAALKMLADQVQKLVGPSGRVH